MFYQTQKFLVGYVVGTHHAKKFNDAVKIRKNLNNTFPIVKVEKEFDKFGNAIFVRTILN